MDNHDDIEAFIQGDEVLLEICPPKAETPPPPPDEPHIGLFTRLSNFSHRISSNLFKVSYQIKQKKQSISGRTNGNVMSWLFIVFVVLLLIVSVGLSIGLSRESSAPSASANGAFIGAIENYAETRMKENKYIVALESGNRMFRKEYVFSPNGDYILEFSNLGSLVLRNTSDVLWESNGEGGGYKCSLQPDGDLVIRRENGRPTWRSDTNKRRFTELRLYDGGQIKLVSPEGIITWVQGNPDYIG